MIRAVSGPDPVGAGGRAISWYDVLGVLPAAPAGRIQREYDAKTSLLRPELLSGAPSNVLTAATRARRLLDTALRVLGDPVSRERYDESAGFRRSGDGLAGPGGAPSDPGWGPSDFSFAGGARVEEVIGSLMAVTEWLAPHPHPPRRVPVPDIRGLFYAACLEVMGRLGLQVAAVRLTEHPMPVDGLVVDQSPLPPAKLRRGGALTVQVWHPAARSAGR
jgi:hypothetical protein